ncbi:MAG: acyltransferase [Betaproteobacteria bacterium]|nr:acyltransferase [Betaproteobacteria bacterium]
MYRSIMATTPANRRDKVHIASANSCTIKDNAAMTTHETAAEDREFLLVEAFRGLAAALVVYTHYWASDATDLPWLRFSHTGVDLFFVLSGYVFGPYFFGKPIALFSFWTRRFFRIYPLYLLALACYLLEKVIRDIPLLYLFEHLSFTYVQSKAMAFYYNPPFWSLPAEVCFYLALPFIAWMMQLAKRSSQGMLGFGILTLLALAARLLLGSHANYDEENQAFILLHHLPGLAIEFLMGAWVWHWARQSENLGFALSLGLLACVAWAAFAWYFGKVGDQGIQASSLRGQLGALAALCYACILYASLRWLRVRRSSNVSSSSGLGFVCVWAGRLSYGTYLFHIAALRATQALVDQHSLELHLSPQWLALGLTVATSLLVHRYWEDPWRSFGRRLADSIGR